MSRPLTARRWGVTALLTAATIGVAVLALALTALLTSPIVRASVESTARDSLARDADLFARLPVTTRLSERADSAALQARIARRGLGLGLVAADGTATGAALALGEDERRTLLAGEPVSATSTLGGDDVLIEARPLRNGTAVVLAARADDVDEAVALQRRRLLLALGLGLLVAAAVGALVARRLARPLAALAGTARRLSGGERGVADGGSTAAPREVAEVAEALAMLDAHLVASEERQRRFLLSVSHELRTPLTAIRGYAESLVDGAVAPEELPEVGETLVRESQRLERHVSDLLALARLEAEDFRIELADVDLAALVAEGVAAWAERAARAGVRLEAWTPAAPLWVRTDAGRVRQILDALTDNAVRVCPPGSRVGWSAAPAGDGAVIIVRDDGPGITEDDARDAFVPGALHARYADQRPGGHGLGLAIAHRLARRLGGSLTAGPAAGGGAEFQLELPAAPQPGS